VSDAVTEHLGWLGTGRMGTVLAGRLVDTGAKVSVWNRTASKLQPLVERGATAVDSITDLGHCGVVFVMVSTPDDLRAVTTGPGGLLTGDALPRIVVECSTVSGTVSSEIRQAAEKRGVAFLAAPISGNPHVVEAGQACFVVSGPEHTFTEVLPYFELLGKRAVLVGDAEQSRLVKLCHNLYLGMMVQALVEVTSLAEKGGTSRAAFLDFLNSTVLSSEWVQRRSKDLIELDWTPTFTTELLRKDFDLGLQAARALEVPMPVSSAVHHLIQSAIGHGFRNQDFLSLYEVQAAGAGLDLASQPNAIEPE
jgi:3-hydroxyisobutyrate dehydrogenase-like beta-hydroxyacid dehydrogenase